MILSKTLRRWLRLASLGILIAGIAEAAPTVSRLTPPSALFSYGDANPPFIARFLTGQRFDLQATIRPDAGKSITKVEFLVDGQLVSGAVNVTPATVSGLPAGTVVATRRAYSSTTTGERRLRVRATQSDGSSATAEGNFEIVGVTAFGGEKARNVIMLIGDGFGIAHRTAARIMLHGVSQGKALAPLAMDEMPVTGIVRTSSLNSIVTDSAPGAAVYSTGNKNDNNQEGVFPDDTTDAFDNPRIENIGEYLARTQGKWLGIVTTADVTDATPGAFGVHTSNRSAGTGIADQFLDEAVPKANLRVLLGGGRAWFLPWETAGSGRGSSSDYQLPEELATGWGVGRGALDPTRDLLKDFQTAGFTYVNDRAKLAAIPAETSRLLGLFHLGHLNAALDRVEKRRGRSTIVDEYGFPDQPMLDEMVTAALAVLRQAPSGFVLMIEAGSIDKQSHAMDTERWLLETIEFDRAVKRATSYAERYGSTLVLVTADHETGGANIIGASTASHATLSTAAKSGGGAASLRDPIVGTYTAAGFPQYTIRDDGFPETTNIDRRLLIGYAANADRHEDWVTNTKPIGAPGAPGSPRDRDAAGGFLVTGQVPGSQAVHTASDVPLSAAGEGAVLFTGAMDNTDVFFKTMQAVLGGGPMLSSNGTILTTAASSSATSSSLGSGQRTATNRLINLSTRGFVGTGSSILISGFVLEGNAPHRLLIRGIGPALAKYGVSDVLGDPVLRLCNSAGAEIASNNNWSDSNAAAIAAAASSVGAFALPLDSKDATLLVTLPPGRYSVQLVGNGNTTGNALLEVYEMP
jgi:alkaline phosphatase